MYKVSGISGCVTISADIVVFPADLISLSHSLYWDTQLHTGLELRVRNRKITFLFLNQNICCGCSKEPSHWDGSFEYPKQMLKVSGKKIFTILRWKCLFIYVNLCTYLMISGVPGLKILEMWVLDKKDYEKENVFSWFIFSKMQNWFSNKFNLIKVHEQLLIHNACQ